MDFSMRIARGSQKLIAEKILRDAQHATNKSIYAEIGIRIRKDLRRAAYKPAPLTRRQYVV